MTEENKKGLKRSTIDCIRFGGSALAIGTIIDVISHYNLDEALIFGAIAGFVFCNWLAYDQTEWND